MIFLLLVGSLLAIILLAVDALIAATRKVCFLVDICKKSIETAYFDLLFWLFPY